MLLIPNKLILDSFNHEKVPYTGSLEWKNFKGVPDENYFADAIISNGYQYKINRVYNFPKIVIGSYMNPYKSWKKEIKSELGSKLLLKHEQGHFDIREAFRIKILDSISSNYFHSADESENIVEHFSGIQVKTDELYDEETYHGSILEKQEIWNTKIDSMLGN
ncbi:hypothetical protein [Winogradskyella litorisediminis]